MTTGPLRLRTRAFAVAVLKTLDTLPRTSATRIIEPQLGRCATSVGANYRRAAVAQSARDFVAKMKIVEEETDEAELWLDLLLDLRLGERGEIGRLKAEVGEIRAMTIASIKTARARATQQVLQTRGS